MTITTINTIVLTCPIMIQGVLGSGCHGCSSLSLVLFCILWLLCNNGRSILKGYLRT